MTNLASEVRVNGIGPTNAKIMLIGESPGEQEVLNHEPFVGQAGKVLNGLLTEVGIARQEVYLENVVQYRPKGNKFEEFYETHRDGGKKVAKPSALLVEEIGRLHEKIKEIHPNIIVCLGEEPLKAVTGKTFKGGITGWRGSILTGVHGTKVVGTFHPSYLLRAWSDRPLTAYDLRKAKEESWFPEIRRRPRHIEHNLPYRVLLNRLSDIRDNSDFVAFDIETENNHRTISAISFADSPEYSLVVPFQFKGRTFWQPNEEKILKGYIKEILEKEGIQKIAQNAQYDMLILKDLWGIDVAPLYMDTMIAHALSMPEYDKSLALQCSIYTDIPYYKQDLHSTDVTTFLEYNGRDSLATFECATEIQQQLEEDNLWDFYLNLPHRLLQPLREMSLRGIRIDTKLRTKMAKENKAARDRLTQIIREEPTCHEYEKTVVQKNAKAKIAKRWQESHVKCLNQGKWPKSAIGVKYSTPQDYVTTRSKEIPEFNPNSSAQLCGYLYDFRGWKPILKRRSDGRRTPTADAGAIKKLLSQHNEPILQTFLDLSDLIKESEFLSAKLESDGRLHSTYDITGTETGRISSKKYVYDTGANLQNQPAGKRKESVLRRVFIPDEGKVFVQRDLKQAEAWVVAFLSEDPFFMEAIQSEDIHRATASLIFQKPKAKITKPEREKAKRCVHALNYGMGYKKFAEEVGIPVSEAQDLYNRYFAAFPRLKIWHSDIKNHLARDRMMMTPLGRKREFAAGWNEDLWKEAWAFMPQSTVGDLLNIGFIAFSDWLKSPVEWDPDAGLDKKTGIRHGLPEYPLLALKHGRPNGPASNELFFDCQVMLQIHDSIVAQCPPEHVEVIAAKMKECLEREIEINGHKITIPTDCSVGPNWFDLKEVKE